jgi:hypothetical protein
MKNFFKWTLISISILAIGTFLYAQTAVIGIPWELRGVDVWIGTSTGATGTVFVNDSSPAGPSISRKTEATGLSFVGSTIRFWSAGVLGATITDFDGFRGAKIVLDMANADTILLRDAANTLAQRNGANAQTFRLYTSYTDAGNYERLVINAAAGEITFLADTFGSGTDDINIRIQPAGLGNTYIPLSGGYLYVLQTISGYNNTLLSTMADFGDNNPNFIATQRDCTTVDATTTTLHSITLTDANVYLIEARVVARCTGGAGGNVGNGVSYILKQAFKRSGGGAVAIGVLTSESWEDAAIAAWSAVLDVNGNDVRVRVTGAATDDATWHVTVFIQNLSS